VCQGIQRRGYYDDMERCCAIPEVLILSPARHTDARGYFSEVYNKRELEEAGVDIDFVQDNHSMSNAPGTVRGLHFQTQPYAQAKLVRVPRGAIFDVAVDLRWGSPTYGHHVSAILSAKAWNQMLVPIGFAHGYMTLEPETEVVYKVSNYYSPAHEMGAYWNDPCLGIDWPFPEQDVVVGERDRNWPTLGDLPVHFTWSDL